MRGKVVGGPGHGQEEEGRVLQIREVSRILTQS